LANKQIDAINLTKFFTHDKKMQLFTLEEMTSLPSMYSTTGREWEVEECHRGGRIVRNSEQCVVGTISWHSINNWLLDQDMIQPVIYKELIKLLRLNFEDVIFADISGG